jgi:hypothetical protein
VNGSSLSSKKFSSPEVAASLALFAANFGFKLF